jgi:hypothetical protein
MMGFLLRHTNESLVPIKGRGFYSGYVRLLTSQEGFYSLELVWLVMKEAFVVKYVYNYSVYNLLLLHLLFCYLKICHIC